MLEEKITELIVEIKNELKLPIEDSEIKNYIKEGIYEINEVVGEDIDYVTDLKARKLLKNYVTYSVYKRLAEFKTLYAGEIVDVQIKYNRDTII